MAKFKILTNGRIAGLRGRFNTGYYKTDDPDYIAVLRNNSAAVEVIENPEPEPIPMIIPSVKIKEKKEVKQVGKHHNSTK